MVIAERETRVAACWESLPTIQKTLVFDCCLGQHSKSFPVTQLGFAFHPLGALSVLLAMQTVTLWEQAGNLHCAELMEACKWTCPHQGSTWWGLELKPEEEDWKEEIDDDIYEGMTIYAWTLIYKQAWAGNQSNIYENTEIKKQDQQIFTEPSNF